MTCSTSLVVIHESQIVVLVLSFCLPFRILLKILLPSILENLQFRVNMQRVLNVTHHSKSFSSTRTYPWFLHKVEIRPWYFMWFAMACSMYQVSLANGQAVSPQPAVRCKGPRPGRAPAAIHMSLDEFPTRGRISPLCTIPYPSTQAKKHCFAWKVFL